MYGITPDIAVSILRHILTFIAGIIVARGWIGAEVATQLVGGIIGLVGVLFAAFFHSASNGVVPPISTTSNMQQKTVTETTTNTAEAPVK